MGSLIVRRVGRVVSRVGRKDPQEPTQPTLAVAVFCCHIRNSQTDTRQPTRCFCWSGSGPVPSPPTLPTGEVTGPQPIPHLRSCERRAHYLGACSMSVRWPQLWKNCRFTLSAAVDRRDDAAAPVIRTESVHRADGPYCSQQAQCRGRTMLRYVVGHALSRMAGRQPGVRALPSHSRLVPVGGIVCYELSGGVGASQ
jgi:hypothetical protein